MKKLLPGFNIYHCAFVLAGFLSFCKPKIKENTDAIYSRHLQKRINLTVLSTPVPDDKNLFNLLLLNDGQDIEKFRVKKYWTACIERSSLNRWWLLPSTPLTGTRNMG